MGYPIDEYPRTLFNNEYHQVALVTMETAEGSLMLSDSDIVAGGLSINRYCVTGDRIEVGSVTAAELRLKLNNFNGAFATTKFEDAELYVQIGVRKTDAVGDEDDNYHYIPMGYFRVDNPPRKRGVIELVALDRMMEFDRLLDPGMIVFPITVGSLLYRLCDICGVTPGSDFDALTNHGYRIDSAPEGSYTCRQYLSWLAEMTGSCAWIDWEGKLRLGWYGASSHTLTASERYSHEIDENPVVLTGVQVIQGEDTYLEGSSEYCISLRDNPLVTHDHRLLAQALRHKLNGFSYVPFKAAVVSMPYVYPLDTMTFTKTDGTEVPVIITDVTYILNNNTIIAGKGETNVRNRYASTGGFTRRESAIITSLEKKLDKNLASKVSDVLEFNRLLGGAMGMYSTPYTLGDGSTIYYMHDSPSLDESRLIYTMTARGVAWTDQGWNDGNPIWTYGATSAGDALFRKLSAEGIVVSKAGQDYEIRITPDAFAIYYRGMPVSVINGDEMDIPNAYISHYLQIGKIRWVPAEDNGVLVGTDLIWIE